MSWNYLVAASCFALLVFMVWKEISRTDRSRMLLRVTAGCMAVAAFACMALPLAFTSAVTASKNPVVLLTDGFNRDSVAHFLRQFQKQPPVYSFTATSREREPANTINIYDPDTLYSMAAGSQQVEVFGYGFMENELSHFKDHPFRFHPSPLPAGITFIHWNRQLKQGENLLIQGTCSNPGAASITVKLTGLQAQLDSAFIPPHSTKEFTLAAVPRLAGKALYAVTVLAGSDTLEQEPVPVVVDTAGKINVLMLASSPDFENRFLKEWLAKQGYNVAVRTIITTNKYNKLSVNAAAAIPPQLDQHVLKQIDVLVSDPASFTQLSAPEQGALKTQVANGMGLLIRADSLLPGSFYAGLFPLVQTSDSLRRQLHIYNMDVAADTALWTAEQPVYIRTHAGTQPLVLTTESKILASSTLYGSGKIVLLTLNNTFSWLLAGNEKTYSWFWSLLLKKAARKNIPHESWSFSPALPFAGEPVKIGLQVNDRDLLLHTISGTTVPYRQNALLPFQWQSVYWPEAGWQTAAGNAVHKWFTYSSTNWRTIKAKQKLFSTENYLLRHANRVTQAEKETIPVSRPAQKIYFLIIFIIAVSYLWIEKKFMR